MTRSRLASLAPSLSSLWLALCGGVVVAGVGAACSTAGGPSGAASRGERFFQAKCNACHPNGGQGAGPPIDAAVAPGFLERGKSSGRHGVPEAEWDALIAHLNQRFGGAAAPAATATDPGTATTPTTPAVATANLEQGQRSFQARCNRCHPGGGRGVGPSTVGAALPGPLKAADTGGRHDIPAGEFNDVVAYVASLAGPAPTPTPTPTPTPAPMPTPTPTTTTTPPPPPAGGDGVAGAGYYQARCNRCHPGGNRGVGPAIAGKPLPGVLKAVANGGRHDVDPGQFENLMVHLVAMGAVRLGTAAAPPVAPTGPAPLPTTTTPAPTTTPGAISPTAGMVPYTCACQCPANTPAAALPAACVCQCTPR